MPAIAAAPLLRSPPFPRVPTHVATVCAPLPGTGGTGSDTTLAPLIDRIRAARVGGTFWGARPVPHAAVRRWCALDTLGDVRRWRAAETSSEMATETLIVLPSRLRSIVPMLRGSCAQVVVGDVDPWHMFDHVARCDAAHGSELALLAAIANTPGAYASDDWRGAAADRLLHNLAYRDPFTDTPASPERAVEILAAWRQAIDRNYGLAAAIGIARWKQPTIGAMLWGGARDLPFYRRAAPAVRRAAVCGGAITIWPAKAPADTLPLATAAGVRVATIEDGFIRSRGLGSDCVPPLSIALDGPHPHYDPGGPSALETTIQSHRFDAALLARTDRLVATLIAQGVGKYDVGRGAGRLRPPATRVVLIAGQVEDDASWALGGAGVASNLDLLRRVRVQEPDAWLIFRPHPDVEAGHRIGFVADHDALRYVDEVDRHCPLAALLDVVDAVHVLTSLTGFEALLRDREVVVHGLPFYAGWGVTRDLARDPAMPAGVPTIARRTRRASIREIAAAAFILYPHYLDPVTGLPCTPERLVERLVAGCGMPTSLLTRARRLRRHMPFARAG